MKKLTLVISTCAVLAGCAADRVGAIREQLIADKNACRSEPRTTYVALAQCMNRAEKNAHIAAGMGGHDLLELRLASRVAIAEKQDKKLLTDAEAELEFAKVGAQIGTEERTRATNAQIADAASQMAAPRRSTCTRIGNTVNCW